MTEHHVYWFESDDGKIFADEMDCIGYELNLLYRKSGVRLYIRDKEVKELVIENDRTYNESTDIFIDRSRNAENREFGDRVHDWCGWCYIEEAIAGTGTHYRMFWNKLVEVK